MDLAEFFDTMLPFLLGDVGLADASARVGPSPCGAGRFAFYPELVRRERASTLRLLYPATRLAANRLQPGLFAELVQSHLAEHRSMHWEPNHFGAPFPGLVAGHCKDEPLALLSELADYEWLKFAVTVERGTPLYFRGYDHDLVGYVERASRGDDCELPPKRSVALAIHRSADQRAVVTSLGELELAILARRRGVPIPHVIATEPEIRAAEERLTRLGLLADYEG